MGSGAVLLALSGPFVWAGYHQYTGLAALTNYHSAEAREHLEACLRVWPWSRSSRLHLLAARAARREGNFDSAREHLHVCQDQQGDAPPEPESVLEWAMLGKAEMMANFDALVTDRRIRRADVAQFIADPANLGKSYLRRYASSRPWAHRAAPRLVWAGAESGCRRTPSRRLRTARSTFPCPARAMPRLTWALAKSGFRRNASW